MKLFKLSIEEVCTYRHDVTISIPDTVDIDAVCDRIHDHLNESLGDLSILGGINDGYFVEAIVKDESPDVECEIEEYDEVTE